MRLKISANLLRRRHALQDSVHIRSAQEILRIAGGVDTEGTLRSRSAMRRAIHGPTKRSSVRQSPSVMSSLTSTGHRKAARAAGRRAAPLLVASLLVASMRLIGRETEQLGDDRVGKPIRGRALCGLHLADEACRPGVPEHSG